jgi:hypothetical protein
MPPTLKPANKTALSLFYPPPHQTLLPQDTSHNSITCNSPGLPQIIFFCISCNRQRQFRVYRYSATKPHSVHLNFFDIDISAVKAQPEEIETGYFLSCVST